MCYARRPREDTKSQALVWLFDQDEEIADVTREVLAEASQCVGRIFLDGVVGDSSKRVATKTGRTCNFGQCNAPMFVLRFPRQQDLKVVAHKFHPSMMTEDFVYVNFITFPR